MSWLTMPSLPQRERLQASVFLLLPSSNYILIASFWLDTKHNGAKYYACQNKTIKARHKEESQWKWEASLLTFHPFMRNKSHAWGHLRAGLNSILQGLRVFLHAPLPVLLSQAISALFSYLNKDNKKCSLMKFLGTGQLFFNYVQVGYMRWREDMSTHSFVSFFFSGTWQSESWGQESLASCHYSQNSYKNYLEGEQFVSIHGFRRFHLGYMVHALGQTTTVVGRYRKEELFISWPAKKGKAWQEVTKNNTSINTCPWWLYPPARPCLPEFLPPHRSTYYRSSI